MNKEKAQKLFEIFAESEVKIKIVDGPFLDGFVTAMFEMEQSDVDEDHEGIVGDIVYSSETFIHRSLSTVPETAIHIYKEITKELFN